MFARSLNDAEREAFPQLAYHLVRMDGVLSDSGRVVVDALRADADGFNDPREQELIGVLAQASCLDDGELEARTSWVVREADDLQNPLDVEGTDYPAMAESPRKGRWASRWLRQTSRLSSLAKASAATAALIAAPSPPRRRLPHDDPEAQPLIGRQRR